MKKTFELRQERNFGAKISGAFEFIKQNFKGLAKPILYVAVPAALLAGYFLSEYFLFAFSTIQNPNIFDDGEFSISGMVLNYSGMLLTIMLGSLLVVCVIFSYFALYDEDKDRDISYSLVFAKLRKRFWRFLGYNIVYILMFSVIFAVVTVICIIFPVFVISQSPGIGMLLFFLLLSVFILFIMFFISFAHILQNTVFFENLSIGKTLSRTIALMKGHWWETLGLMLVISLITSILGYIFIIPLYVIMFLNIAEVDLKEAGKILTIAVSMLSMFGSFLTTLLMQIPMTIQYFNLVERKDGTGLVGQIEKIGQASIDRDEDE